jgi:hypothetical protein
MIDIKKAILSNVSITAALIILSVVVVYLVR